MLIISITLATLVTALLFTAIKRKQANNTPCTLFKRSFGTSNNLAIYREIEDALALHSTPEEVIDGCTSLLRQYTKQTKEVMEIEISQTTDGIIITITPGNITIKVK